MTIQDVRSSKSLKFWPPKLFSTLNVNFSPKREASLKSFAEISIDMLDVPSFCSRSVVQIWPQDTFWVFVGTNALCLWVALILPETKDGDRAMWPQAGKLSCKLYGCKLRDFIFGWTRSTNIHRERESVLSTRLWVLFDTWIRPWAISPPQRKNFGWNRNLGTWVKHLHSYYLPVI